MEGTPKVVCPSCKLEKRAKEDQQAEVIRKGSGALEKALQEERVRSEAQQKKMPDTYEKAVTMAKAGNYSQAVTLFEELTKLDPDYKDVRLKLKAARAAREKLAAQTTLPEADAMAVRRELTHTGEAGDAEVDNGRSSVWIGVTKDAYDEIQSAASANDVQGLLELVALGKAFTVQPHTRVLVIDRSFLLRRVRIMEGPQQGASGWLPFEYVHK